MPPVICWATPAISCWDHSKMSDIHPREMDLLRGFGKDVIERGFAQTEKLTCLTAAGRNIPVIMYGAVHEDDSGRRLIRAIVIDNLDQQVMEQALRDEVTESYNYEEISGTSAGLRGVLEQVERVAPTDSTALILGETGTGKGADLQSHPPRQRATQSPVGQAQLRIGTWRAWSVRANSVRTCSIA